MYKDPKAISNPFERGDEKIDAILASAAETICDELGMPVPDWLKNIPACKEPYFVSDIKKLEPFVIAPGALPQP